MDRLYYVPRDRRFTEPTWIDVEKIGRKFVYAGRRRFFKDTLFEDGGAYMSQNRAYRTREEYEHIVARQDAWREVGKAAGISNPPAGVSLEAMQEALRLITPTPPGRA